MWVFSSAISAPIDKLLLLQLGDASDVGFSFVDGFVFLERFYSTFDTTNNRVGFDTTSHTDDETN